MTVYLYILDKERKIFLTLFSLFCLFFWFVRICLPLKCGLPLIMLLLWKLFWIL